MDVIAANEARLNITWDRRNGDLPDPVSYDATDGDVFTMAAEAVRGGSVPGIPADPNVNFQDFRVERFDATGDVPYNKLVLRPKTPFG